MSLLTVPKASSASTTLFYNALHHSFGVKFSENCSTSLKLHMPNNGNQRALQDHHISRINVARELTLWRAVASTSFTQIDVDHLECEFQVHGITFTRIGGSCVVRMALEDGSTATLMLPSGLITSYKPRMWHGATMELLHTSVSKGQESSTSAVIQGGLSLALGFKNDAGVSWSPDAWSLHQVDRTPQESIQVELISRNEEGNAEVKHIITLGQDHLTSEILVSNSSTTSVHLTGSVLSHLAVSTPDAAYALGLEGSKFLIRPPFETDFTIIPPDFLKIPNQDPGKFWAFNGLFSKWDVRNQNASADGDVERLGRDTKQELTEVEEDNNKHLTQKLSRIFNDTAPRNVTIIDRGRRNSVTVRRNGFNELYILSPGSAHEWYAKYSYICIGHAALLEPITLNPESEWKGGLQLWNPNA